MRTVVYGLDGADLELVERWEEELPNFQKLREEGFIGELGSTKPPITMPAWMCMFSGRGPEEFGAYDFHFLDFEDYSFRVVDSSFFRGKSLIDSKEKRTISYRVPGTTPGYRINGDMVTGFVKGEKPEIFPRELEDELRKNVDFDVRPIEGDEETKKENSVHNFKQNNRAFRWMLENREFERVFSVFRLIDTWMHNVKREEEMFEAYKEADRALGEIIEMCEERGWNLIVVSDHGSGNTNRKLYLNAWLREKGYTEYIEQEEKVSRRLMYHLVEKAMELGLKPVLKAGARVWRAVTGRNPKPHKSGTMEKIDWENTEAFSYLSAVSNYGAVWIHDRERFPNGTVEDREEKTGEIKRELEKEDYISNVYTNQELYQDGEMPDLVVEAESDVVVGPEIYTNKFHNTRAVAHNFNGLIAGLGPGLREGKKVKAEIIDLASTIEAIEGKVEVKDGRPLIEVLKDQEVIIEEEMEV
ncbi:MAG: alkaline phosphatase family protein [Candidatus Nanohaloarchaea archaeon]|nr:alkaline phosphatase family protein [Candidatus Nanohaloarchaea archaeon]